MLLQHPGNGASGDAMIQVPQSALYPGIAPAGILLSHPDGQFTDLFHHTGPTNTLKWIRPFGGDEFAVPCEYRVGGYDGGYLAQHCPAQRLAFCCQSAALVISETKPSPVRLELLFQHPILFYQIGDNRCLFPSNPASERGQEEFELDGFNHLGSITEGVASGVVTVRLNFRTLRGRCHSV